MSQMEASMRRLGWMVAVLALAAPMGAKVIGHTEAPPPMDQAHVDKLPASVRKAWTEYLQRSESQMRADHAALDAERKGLSEIPPIPPSAPGVRPIPLNRDAAWYGSAEARTIADNMISFQIPSGGWGKNLELAKAPRQRGQSYVSDNENRFSDANDLDKAKDAAWHYVGTIDNDATVTEIRFLAKVASATPGEGGKPYRDSVARGLTYLLHAQYPNGGWPQVWPLEGGYHDAITINDDAMRNVVEVLQNLGSGDLAFVGAKLKEEAHAAAAKGIDCLLKAQVVIAGKKTIWAQQYDPPTLTPVAARNYEPASLSSSESASVIELLAAQTPQTPALKTAIADGKAWLLAHELKDIAVEGGRNTPEGRHVVAKPGAGPLWARYYSITTGEPIFGDRDRTIHDTMADISAERRNGYAWYNGSAAKILGQ